MLVNSALTFCDVARLNEPRRWSGVQPDGAPVGTIEDRKQAFVVSMVDTLGNPVLVDYCRSLGAAQRKLVKAWQVQLSKGGNP